LRRVKAEDYSSRRVSPRLEQFLINPPEIELCLLLSRSQLSPQAWERALELLSTPLHWEFLLERAKDFGLFPLVYTALSTHGFPGVPDAVREEWTSIFRLHVIRTELLATELARILRLFSDARISAMPLKGIPTAESLYGDAALRVSNDVDLLVPLDSAIPAFHLLVSSGYHSEFTNQPRLLELNLRYGKDCLLTRKEPAYTVGLELHSALVWGSSLDRGLLEQVWAEAPRIVFRGVPAFALSADWEFLYLAILASRHGGSSLKWYADLDRMCYRSSVNWKKASQRAQSLGWEKVVRSSLETCSALVDTSFDSAFGSPPPSRRGRVPLPSEATPHSSNLIILFRLLNTPGRKLRFLAIRLFVPTAADCNFCPLPDSLFFLYYLLRPLRVAVKAGGWFSAAGIKRFWRLLSGVHLW